MDGEFNGFHEETLKFLVELKLNNNKEWFDENRERYSEFILEPSKAFVFAMGKKLNGIAPGIIADPRVNGSLFRLNRDVRFSPDKTPYKTHLGIFLWEGPRKRMESPGFYMQIDPDSLMFAGGVHMLPKDLLDPFRKVVAKKGPAGELAGIVKNVEEAGIEVKGSHYKKNPRDYSDDHPNSYFLKYNGAYGMDTIPIPDEFFRPELVDMAFNKFKVMDPMNRWFLKYLY